MEPGIYAVRVDGGEPERVVNSGFDAHFGASGDRVCVRLQGGFLEMTAAKDPETETDFLAQLPAQLPREYYLVESAEMVEATSALGEAGHCDDALRTALDESGFLELGLDDETGWLEATRLRAPGDSRTVLGAGFVVAQQLGAMGLEHPA